MHHLSSSQGWQVRGPWNLSPQTTLLLNKPTPDTKVPIQKEIKKASLPILMFDKIELKPKLPTSSGWILNQRTKDHDILGKYQPIGS